MIIIIIIIGNHMDLCNFRIIARATGKVIARAIANAKLYENPCDCISIIGFNSLNTALRKTIE